MGFAPTPPAPEQPAPWPRMFTPAIELLDWLNRQQPLDAASRKRIVTLRWLVFGELERSAPDPRTKAITDFIPDEKINLPGDLTSGHC